MSGFENGVWISWEDHRRSRELSRSFGVEYRPFVYSGPRYKRYPYLAFLTFQFLIRERPKLVFCQNPSLVLTTLIVLIRPLFGYKVIVDRHSNFKLEYADSRASKWRLFHYLSKFTINKSELTIVTNSYLKGLCEEFGGRSLILPDKIPEMSLVDIQKRPSVMEKGHMKRHIMVVTTFDDDEPIDELVSAGIDLPDDYVIYLTGNFRKKFSDIEAERLKNQGIIFTGFVEESVYQNLMYHSDVVVVLTKKDHILNCGAYEAYSLRKPLVLSDTTALREYFRLGCLFTVPHKNNITDAIMQALAERKPLIDSMNRFLPELKSEWEKSFENIKLDIKNI